MQKLFDLFKEIGLPYYRQGSLSDEDYKPSFFTFWNIDTPNTQHRDNTAKEYTPYIQVGYYTNNANLIYSQLEEGGEFYTKAKAKGFLIDGRAQDADADKDNYFGRVCYIRIKNKSED